MTDTSVNPSFFINETGGETFKDPWRVGVPVSYTRLPVCVERHRKVSKVRRVLSGISYVIPWGGEETSHPWHTWRKVGTSRVSETTPSPSPTDTFRERRRTGGPISLIGLRDGEPGEPTGDLSTIWRNDLQSPLICSIRMSWPKL